MVSVIIPYFNRYNTLPRALDSVRLQTYKDFELILVNDGSTDQSQRVVEEYLNRYPEICSKHITQENSGPSGARNNGIKNATGKYIAFLDSDDTWEPLKLETQIDYMERNSDVVITGTNYYIVHKQKWTKYSHEPAVIEANFYRMLFKVFYATPTIVVRSEVFFCYNIWYMMGKNQGEDLLLYLQILRKYRGVRLSKPLASVFKLEYGVDGLTSDLGNLLRNELDNLKILLSENKVSSRKINYALYLVLIVYSYLKHIKRMIKSSRYKRKYLATTTKPL